MKRYKITIRYYKNHSGMECNKKCFEMFEIECSNEEEAKERALSLFQKVHEFEACWQRSIHDIERQFDPR
jgi:hypothetical protein